MKVLNKIPYTIEIMQYTFLVDPGWKLLSESFDIIETVIDEYVAFNKKWNNNSTELRYIKNKNGFTSRGSSSKPSNGIDRNIQQQQSNNPPTFNGRYKTRMCRDILNKGTCPRGTNCTYAHVYEELRPPHENESNNDFLIHKADDMNCNGIIHSSKEMLNGHSLMKGNEIHHHHMQPQEVISMPLIPMQPMHDQMIRMHFVQKTLYLFNFFS